MYAYKRCTLRQVQLYVDIQCLGWFLIRSVFTWCMSGRPLMMFLLNRNVKCARIIEFRLQDSMTELAVNLPWFRLAYKHGHTHTSTDSSWFPQWAGKWSFSPNSTTFTLINVLMPVSYILMQSYIWQERHSKSTAWQACVVFRSVIKFVTKATFNIAPMGSQNYITHTHTSPL